MKLQSLFPVYLPRREEQGQTREEYDAGVAVNENSLNQNFSILYQALSEVLERLEE